MQRRRFLVAAAGAAVATAGCSGSDSTDPESTEDGPETPVDRTGDLNVTLAAEQGFKVTYRDLVATDEIVTEDQYDPRATPAEGKRYVLVKVRAKQTADDGGVPDPDRFRLVTESSRYAVADVATAVEGIAQPVNGSVYTGGGYSTSVGTTESGWLPFEVPADADTFTLTVQEATTEDDESLRWNVLVDRPDVATFDVVVDGPEETTVGEEVAYALTVEHTGGRDGRFYREVTLGGDGVEGVEKTLDYTMEAGESRSTELTATPGGVGTVTVSTRTTTLSETDAEPAQLSFGETWTTPQGLELTVEEVVRSQSTTYAVGDGTESADAGSGLQFAFVRIAAVNPTTESAPAPSWDDGLQLSADGETYADPFDPTWSDEEWRQPVDAGWFSGGSIDSGEEASGVVPFKIPAGLTDGDVEVVASWSTGWGGPTVEAVWGASGGD